MILWRELNIKSNYLILICYHFFLKEKERSPKLLGRLVGISNKRDDKFPSFLLIPHMNDNFIKASINVKFNNFYTVSF